MNKNKKNFLNILQQLKYSQLIYLLNMINTKKNLSSEKKIGLFKMIISFILEWYKAFNFKNLPTNIKKLSCSICLKKYKYKCLGNINKYNSCRKYSRYYPTHPNSRYNKNSNGSNEVIILKCGHHFHFSCFEKWLYKNIIVHCVGEKYV